MTPYQRQWRLFGNGLLQAIYSGVGASVATFAADGLFNLDMDRRQFTASVLTTVIAYVWGWAKNNQLPPIFRVDEEDVKTLTKVADVVTTADAKIAQIADKATEEIAVVVADAPKKE